MGGATSSKTKVVSKPAPRTKESKALLSSMMGLMGLGELPSTWLEDPYVRAYLEETGDTAIISPLRALTEYRKRTAEYEDLLRGQIAETGALRPSAFMTALQAFSLPPIVVKWGNVNIPLYPFRTQQRALNTLTSLYALQEGLSKGIYGVGRQYLSSFYNPLLNAALQLEMARMHVPGTRVTEEPRGWLHDVLGAVGSALLTAGMSKIFGGGEQSKLLPF